MIFKNEKFFCSASACTNIVACIADAAPAPHWIECNADILIGLTRLYVVGGVQYFGYL